MWFTGIKINLIILPIELESAVQKEKLKFSLHQFAAKCFFG